MPGRPKKARVKAPDENNSKVSRRGKQMRCSNCQTVGHNKTTCDKPSVPKPPIVRRPVGRKREPQHTPASARVRGRGNRGGRGSGSGGRGQGSGGRGSRGGGRGSRGGATGSRGGGRGNGHGGRGNGHGGSAEKVIQAYLCYIVFLTYLYTFLLTYMSYVNVISIQGILTNHISVCRPWMKKTLGKQWNMNTCKGYWMNKRNKCKTIKERNLKDLVKKLYNSQRKKKRCMQEWMRKEKENNKNGKQ